MTSYWENHWREIRGQGSGIQAAVERSKKGIPIDDALWSKTLDFVINKMDLNPDSHVLDLCSGTGVLAVPIAKHSMHITAVDFTPKLLDMLKNYSENEKVSNITIVNKNILSGDFPAEEFTHIILYASLQYFTQQESLIIFEKANRWLRKGGVFYVGDIPDSNRLWNFANTPEYERSFFDSVKNGEPAIGTWFDPEFLLKLGKYSRFSDGECIEQPSYQINSHYRFDLLFKK